MNLSRSNLSSNKIKQFFFVWRVSFFLLYQVYSAVCLCLYQKVPIDTNYEILLRKKTDLKVPNTREKQNKNLNYYLKKKLQFCFSFDSPDWFWKNCTLFKNHLVAMKPKIYITTNCVDLKLNLEFGISSKTVFLIAWRSFVIFAQLSLIII